MNEATTRHYGVWGRVARCCGALAVGLLCAVVLGAGATSARTARSSAGMMPRMTLKEAATMPRLWFPCGAPASAAVVTCRLSGKGFYPHERVRIAYHVDISMASGRHVRPVYHRTTTTDGRGSFTRPVFWLRVDPRVLIYKTTVVVTGLRGDQATITTAGTP